MLLLLPTFSGCGAQEEKKPLVIFAAGSLAIPFEQLSKAYEAKHPEAQIQLEEHGSIQVIRHVTDIHEKIDIVASADHDLIPMLMYATNDPDTGKPYASWYIEFATNKLSIAYTDKSKYANEISADNWYKILTRPDVRVGLPDPRFDACGYRAFMVMQLAKTYYNYPTVLEDFVIGQFKMPITVEDNGGQSVIHIPEVVETQADSNVVIRGASMQTIALLQSGDIDYAFDYESVIQQHGLKMVNLPDELNLGSEKFASEYSQVQVNLDFQRFATVKPVFKGGVIGYGITIPSNAPNAAEARDFIAYLLGPEGQKIMSDNFHPMIDPPRASNYDAIPKELQSLCVRWR
jgi:molybdate/tungstate transport system substrate-binding protein